MGYQQNPKVAKISNSDLHGGRPLLQWTDGLIWRNSFGPKFQAQNWSAAQLARYVYGDMFNQVGQTNGPDTLAEVYLGIKKEADWDPNSFPFKDFWKAMGQSGNTRYLLDHMAYWIRFIVESYRQLMVLRDLEHQENTREDAAKKAGFASISDPLGIFNCTERNPFNLKKISSYDEHIFNKNTINRRLKAVEVGFTIISNIALMMFFTEESKELDLGPEETALMTSYFRNMGWLKHWIKDHDFTLLILYL